MPIDAIEATLRLMRKVENVESCVFWFGIRNKDADVVVSVRAPAQQMRATNYHIASHALSAMLGDVPEHWRPLAQAHCHPGNDVEHSAYDEIMIGSKTALSLVFPCYGLSFATWPTGVGVHEWQNGFWHLLSLEHVAGRIAIGPANGVDIRDFRS